MAAPHFHSESIARECIPESTLTNSFLVEKLSAGHAVLAEPLKSGMKVSEA
jgi:hypothetical protein